MKLSKYEQETIILFNEEEIVASVYTYNEKLKDRLRMMSQKYPDDCQLIRVNDEGGETYHILKKLVSIRLPYSKERRKRDSEIALAQNRKPPWFKGAEAPYKED